MMEAVLASLAFATFIKDAIEVWEKIEQSFSRVSQNRRRAQRLVRELDILVHDLKELYNTSHETLDKSEKTGAVLQDLIKSMQGTYETCARLIPPVVLSEKRFKRYIVKYYAWKNGPKIEEELTELKTDVETCCRHFTMLAMTRTEIGMVELRQVTIARSQIIHNMLSDLTVSDNHVRAFTPRRSGISPSIIIDIPDEYLAIQLSALSNLITNLARSSLLLRWRFSGPLQTPIQMTKAAVLSLGMDYPILPDDRDVLHRDAVSLALDIQRCLESLFSNAPLHKLLGLMRKLRQMGRRLGMSKQVEGIDYRAVQTREIDDLSRERIHEIDAYEPDVLSKYRYSETRQSLAIWNRKMELFFLFCDRHADAIDASEAVSFQIYLMHRRIHEFYQLLSPLSSSDYIPLSIEVLQRGAMILHELNKDLPLLHL